MSRNDHTVLSLRGQGAKYWRLGIAALLLILAFSFLPSQPENATLLEGETSAGENMTSDVAPTVTMPSAFPNVHIKNFGQMDENFYRGAQPNPDDYKTLAALGIKTIIDLRDDPTTYEKTRSEAAGLRYVNIPMSDKDRPPDDKILAFFTVANDDASHPFYVHCVGGRHRTGLIGAIYRFDKYGWNYDQAYLEMKNYDYYSRWGHGAIKDYVRDYYEKIKFAKPVLSAVQPSTAAPTSQPVTSPPPPKPKE
jgi:protein tyrosine phosphatase (PTP) superfamily phosphohydrolase (DUF442 family)